MTIMELIDAYADAVSDHRLESLYGTHKAYTLAKAGERDEARAAVVEAVEKLERDAARWRFARESNLVEIHMEVDGEWLEHSHEWADDQIDKAMGEK